MKSRQKRPQRQKKLPLIWRPILAPDVPTLGRGIEAIQNWKIGHRFQPILAVRPFAAQISNASRRKISNFVPYMRRSYL